LKDENSTLTLENERLLIGNGPPSATEKRFVVLSIDWFLIDCLIDSLIKIYSIRDKFSSYVYQTKYKEEAFCETYCGFALFFKFQITNILKIGQNYSRLDFFTHFINSYEFIHKNILNSSNFMF